MAAPAVKPFRGQSLGDEREGATIYYAYLKGGVKVEHANYDEVFAYVAAEEMALDDSYWTDEAIASRRRLRIHP